MSMVSSTTTYNRTQTEGAAGYSAYSRASGEPSAPPAPASAEQIQAWKAWLEEALVYRQQANPDEVQQLDEWIKWTSEQLQAASSAQGAVPGQNYQPSYQNANAMPPDPNGLMAGPAQNYIANQGENQLSVRFPDPSNNYATYVWGDKTDLYINYADAKTTITAGVDPLTGEPATILTVTSASTGQSKVFYFMDSETEINVHAVRSERSVTQTGNITNPITIKDFNEETIAEAVNPNTPTRSEGEGEDLVNHFEAGKLDYVVEGAGPGIDVIYGLEVNFVNVPPSASIEVEDTTYNGKAAIKHTITYADGHKKEIYVIKRNTGTEGGQVINWHYVTKDQFVNLTDDKLEAIQNIGDQENAIAFNYHGKVMEEEEVVAPAYPGDATPTRIDDNGWAIYDREEDVTIHPNFDDDVSIHEITAKNVTILKESFTNAVLLNIVGGWYTVAVSGKNAKGETRIEIFRVKADTADSIVLGFEEDQIIRTNFHLEDHPKIKFAGESGEVEYPTVVTDLTTWLKANGNPDITEDDIITAAEEVGLSAEDLNSLTFPPSDKVMRLLEKIDPQFKTLLQTLASSPSNRGVWASARDRFVAMLKEIYPQFASQIVSPPPGALALVGQTRTIDEDEKSGLFAFGTEIYSLNVRENGEGWISTGRYAVQTPEQVQATADVEAATETEAAENTGVIPPMIDALMKAKGPHGGDCVNMTEEEIYAELYRFFPEIDANGNGKIGRAEVRDAITKKKFPPPFDATNGPSPQLKQFLVAISTPLQDKIRLYINGNDTMACEAAYVYGALLGKLYPSENIRPYSNSEDNVSFGDSWADVMNNSPADQAQAGNVDSYWQVFQWSVEDNG